MTDQLLSTKLYLPPTRPDLVHRPRLMQRLDQAVQQGCRLILVSAPAGYGKTTLLAEWKESLKEKDKGEGIKDKTNSSFIPSPSSFILSASSLIPYPLFSSLSLDADDNDPVLFWSYLVAALEPAAPELPQAAQAYLQSPPALSTKPFLAMLINQLAAAARPVVLVLDDYHLISNTGIQQGIEYFVEHLPPRVHLVLLTRADPALPLARLRARGQALVLRADDLRFSSAEVDLLLNRFRSLNLSAQELSTLEARTEGWAAGLQMAALALESLAATRGREVVAGFIQSFGGSQRHILDYLLEEVLDRQPEEIQTFLLCTSILDRMCGPLLEEVLKDKGEGSEVKDKGEGIKDKDRSSFIPSPSSFILSSSSFILDQLDRSNLFVIPLDEERRWYRYHHLFADLLRARLRQAMPERIPGLHLRAARWFEQNSLLTEAISHALAAGTAGAEAAAEMIEKHTISLLDRGELHTLLRWINALPEGTAVRRPWLAVYQGWALALAGRLEDVERLLARIEAPADPALRGHIAAIHAYRTAVTGRTAQALEYAGQALAELPAEAVWARNITQWARGYACRILGDLDGAGQAFSEVVRTGKILNDLLAVSSGTFDLSMIRRAQGRLREAEALFGELFELALQRGAAGLGYLGRSHAGLAGLLYEQNRLEEAWQHVLRSQELNEGWHNPNHDLFTAIVLARMDLARGDLPGTEQALEAAREIGRKFAVTPFLINQAEIIQVRLWLRRGDLDSARRWAESRAPAASKAPASESEIAEALALVRVWIGQQALQAGSATANLEASIALLDGLLSASRAAGHAAAAIEVCVLKALVLHGLGQTAEALASLESAFQLAGSEEFFRIFVDEGEAMKALLQAARGRLKGSSLVYVSRLLSAFQPEAEKGGQQALVEPLTEREIEILQLLEKGLSNPEIAARLILAEGTVKAHVANILRKLDVHNRTQAVTLARDLGILS